MIKRICMIVCAIGILLSISSNSNIFSANRYEEEDYIKAAKSIREEIVENYKIHQDISAVISQAKKNYKSYYFFINHKTLGPEIAIVIGKDYDNKFKTYERFTVKK